MQTEDFVTFDQAKRLKELGFDWGCNHWYHTDEDYEKKLIRSLDYANHSGLSPKALSAPSLHQVEKWLLERYGYFLSVQYNNETENFQCVVYKQTFTQGYYCTNESYVKQIFQGSEDLKSYEPTRCLVKGISKILEILKGNKS